MALNAQVDNHLKNTVGAAGYTVSGSVASLTGALGHAQMQQLIDVAAVEQHTVVLVSGVVKVQPR